jgi:hypothetical protein
LAAMLAHQILKGFALAAVVAGGVLAGLKLYDWLSPAQMNP